MVNMEGLAYLIWNTIWLVSYSVSGVSFLSDLLYLWLLSHNLSDTGMLYQELAGLGMLFYVLFVEVDSVTKRKTTKCLTDRTYNNKTY